MEFDLRHLKRLLNQLTDSELAGLISSAKPRHADALRSLRACSNGKDAAAELGIHYNALKRRLSGWAAINKSFVLQVQRHPVLQWIYPDGLIDRPPQAQNIYKKYFDTKPEETSGWTPPQNMKVHWESQWQRHFQRKFDCNYTGPFLIEVSCGETSVAFLDGFVYRDTHGAQHIAIWFMVADQLAGLSPSLPVGKLLASILPNLCGPSTYVYFELGVDAKLRAKARYFSSLLANMQVGVVGLVDDGIIAPYFQPPLAGVPIPERFALGMAIPKRAQMSRKLYIELLRRLYRIYELDTSATYKGTELTLKQVVEELGNEEVRLMDPADLARSID